MGHPLQEELEVPLSPKYRLFIIAAIVDVVEMIRKDLDGSRAHGSPQ